MHKSANILLLSLMTIFLTGNLSAQEVLFDFDNAPLYSTLPIDQTVSGITAHLSATGNGYSIQNADVLGFTPPGLAGHIIYPNSINLADLLIRFDQILKNFSIMYSCQELGCDDAATMLVTAYMNGNLVGTNTRTATFPGTWPVDTLSCNFPLGFDSVVVHYDSPPPTCQDYGTIFMADNMRVTPLNAAAVSEGELSELFTLRQNYPNPFNNSTIIRYSIPKESLVTLKVYNTIGEEVLSLLNEQKQVGNYQTDFKTANLPSGVYFYRLQAGEFVQTRKMILLK